MTERVGSDEVELLAKCLKDAADAPTMWGPSRSVCDDAADALLALLAERDRLREALAEQSMPCTCHEAYSGRKMQDPECRAGEYGDDCREAIGLPPLCQYNIRVLKGDQT